MRDKSADINAQSLDLSKYPYLQRVDQLKHNYPALRSLIGRLRNREDIGRVKVAKRYADLKVHQGSPGRCAVLTFGDKDVTSTEYSTSAALKEYLDNNANSPATPKGLRRLFILEDLEPGFVDILGDRLGVDPLVFSEQMNTWSSTDSRSVPHRALPSMHNPEESFTLRYFEIRTLSHEDSVRTDSNQMTHAVNRRRIERWRDVDLPNVDPDSRHATIRRCASFWTSGAGELGKASSGVPNHGTQNNEQSWDALILVDPPMDSCHVCWRYNHRERDPKQRQHRADVQWKPSESCKPSCLILEDPNCYKTRMELWEARNWTDEGSVREARHNSSPYHAGGPSLVAPPIAAAQKTHSDFDKISKRRNLGSAFDEMVFYWTQIANPSLLQDVHDASVNSSYYLLKFIAQHWSHQLELIGFHVYNSEWFADEHDANVYSQSPNWRNELQQIAYVSRDINYTIRQMSRFDHAVTLNIERLGVQLGCESLDTNLPRALKEAQKDFLAFSSRLKPLRQRVDDISGIATDAANLRASLKGIQDGEQGLRLSLFAAIIFPLTLIAGMFSMADGYLPGQENFYVFWAASVPLALVIGVLLTYGSIENAVKRNLGKERLARPRPQKKMPAKEVV